MVFCPQLLRTSISGALWRILVRNSFLNSLFRLTLVLMLFFMVGPATAGTLTETDKSVRSIVSGIVSYTRWPSLSGQPKLCIYATSHYTHALSGDEGHNELPYTPAIVHNDREALAATCDAIYFGSESPAKQLELISQYQGIAINLRAKSGMCNWQCLLPDDRSWPGPVLRQPGCIDAQWRKSQSGCINAGTE